METSRSPRAIHSEEEIARILLQLGTIATDPESLRSWGTAPDVPLERLVAIETLTYVPGTRMPHQGYGTIVLDGVLGY